MRLTKSLDSAAFLSVSAGLIAEAERKARRSRLRQTVGIWRSSYSDVSCVARIEEREDERGGISPTPDGACAGSLFAA